jgi:hypothetical protein
MGHLSMPWRLMMLVISLKKLRVEAVDEIQPIVNLWCKAGTERLLLLAGHCSIANDDSPGLNRSKDLSRE